MARLFPTKFIARVKGTPETPKSDAKETNFKEKAHKKDKKLPKRLLFVEEFVRTLNATQAAIKAGYSPKSARQQGHRLLTKADVKAKIDELMKQRLENCNVDTELVLQGLKDIALNEKYPCKDRVKAFSLLGDYLKMWNGDNKPVPDKIEIKLTD